jgi:hypothetical protein
MVNCFFLVSLIVFSVALTVSIILIGDPLWRIFILDQYGYTDAPFSVIKDIFRRLPKSEIILT